MKGLTAEDLRAERGRLRGVCMASVLLVLWVTIPCPTAFATPSFRTDQDKDYPDLGLHMRVLDGSVPEPLPPVETRMGGVCNPKAVWYSTQHVGQWRDQRGNLLILGRATHRLPAIAQQFVPREQIEAAINGPACVFDGTSPQALIAWVKDFADQPLESPFELAKETLPRLNNVIVFPTKDDTTLVFSFRVKIRAQEGGSTPSDWYCMILKTADGSSKSQVQKIVETEFLGALGAASLLQRERNTVRSASLTSGTGLHSGSAPEIRDDPTRVAARKSIANMKGWWSAETPEYIFLSDISSAQGKALIKEAQAFMPALHRAFVRLLPPFSPVSPTAVVRVIESRDEYNLYTGTNREVSLGMFMLARGELVLLRQEDRDNTLGALRHEAFHQYLYYACGMLNYSAWFNEGHAMLFNTAVIDSSGRVEINEGGHCPYLLNHLSAAAVRISTLVRITPKSFYAATGEQRYLDHATAWGLIYYLRKGAPAMRQSAYADIIPTYWKTLQSSKNPETATTAAFAGVDMNALQSDFQEFWTKGREKALRYDPLAKDDMSDR